MFETLLFYYDFSSHQLPQFALTCLTLASQSSSKRGRLVQAYMIRTEMVPLFNYFKGLFSIPMTGNADELDRLFDKRAFS